ncbi:MAG: hypothetical protein JK586_14630 [Nocardiopsis sp. BM-2018]|nr:MAG: hypothetical protein JK586_14630 [Nocardiopsis sp. BM-2018]
MRGVRQGLGQQRQEARVELDRHHPPRGTRQGTRQHAETRADLPHLVVGADARRLDDGADGVRVGEEVLSEGLVGPQAVAREQRVDHAR